MESPHLYRGGVTYVNEGHRYDVVIDTGFFHTVRVPIVLKDLDLPSLRTQSSLDRAVARAAKDAAMKILLNRWVLVQTFKESHHPSTWPAKIFIDAETEFPDVTVEVDGQKLVDVSAYMNALANHDFDPGAIDLKHAERTQRSRKSFQRGS